MSIFVNKHTRVVVQGLTGKEGRFHAEQMIAYGTQVVAGVTPGKGGTTILDRPVYNRVKEAVERHQANASVIFVPAAVAADAVLEALDAGIEVIVCITEGIPVQDMIKARAAVKERGAVLIGPNCPGIITPGEAKLGIMPGNIFTPGEVGFISRSGTLTYEVAADLTRAGLGQSTCIGIGGDPVNGTSFTDCLVRFKDDPATKALVLIGEIGGSQEEEAAAYIRVHRLPAVAFIAGKTAPPGKKMGHAGAIVSGSAGTAAAKIAVFEAAGVPVADTTDQIPAMVAKLLAGVKAIV